jgi:hypothetical protein
MSKILDEENAIVIAAATRMVELGSLVAQKQAEGEESEDEFIEGQKIMRLLKAYRKKDEFETNELEAVLYCLRNLSNEDSFPTMSPLIGQELIIATTPEIVDSEEVDDSVATAGTGNDFNSFIRPGIFFIERSGASNGPDTLADYMLHVAKQNSSSILQMATACLDVSGGSAGEVYVRLFNGTTWSSWTMVNDPSA